MTLPKVLPTLEFYGMRSTFPFLLNIALIASCFLGLKFANAANDAPEIFSSFLGKHCYECHTGKSSEAGLDLKKLGTDLSDAKSFAAWVRVFDRVSAHEMPPKDAEPVPKKTVEHFLESTSKWLSESQLAEFKELGRIRARRLTNFQLERTLHDLLGIDIPLASEMPDEPIGAEFTTYSYSQAMSHFHLEQHLKVVDLALDEAFRRATIGADNWGREFTAKQISRTQKRCREPEFIDQQAVVWSSRLVFYGRLPATEAARSGWYRVRFRASALNKPDKHGVWCTVRTGACVSSAPLFGWVGSFEATEEPKELTFDAWIPEGHMLEIKPADRTLADAKFAGGQAADGEGGPQNVPGIGIDWLTLERIHHGSDQATVRQQLLGGIEVTIDSNDRRRPTAKLTSKTSEQDIRRLMTGFAERAFRRPVTESEVDQYVTLAIESVNTGEDIGAALRLGYRAILCSPRFLYLYEQPGELDDYAIASRLSYLLWSSQPDQPLTDAAEKGQLRQPAMLDKQVERMLKAPRGREFIANFSAQWLEMSQIDFTEPDAKLYNDFDIVVQNSMLDETHRFLQTILDENLNVKNFVDSDFTFLNSRLARYYKLDNVDRDEMIRVRLTPEDRRGGLLGQGAVLKVTANGTNTSPVVRGVWIANRILGAHIPPPPENVPAIEPDIRGAKTIRDQLDRHRNDESCASCHVIIDPPGFALENFDAAGRWRDKYLKLDNGRLKPGATIDPSYTLQDGRSFEDLNAFKKLIASRPEPLAMNIAEKLLAYGTGGPITFSDREDIERIVDEVSTENFGFRSIVKAVVKSRVFLSK